MLLVFRAGFEQLKHPKGILLLYGHFTEKDLIMVGSFLQGFRNLGDLVLVAALLSKT